MGMDRKDLLTSDGILSTEVHVSLKQKLRFRFRISTVSFVVVFIMIIIKTTLSHLPSDQVCNVGDACLNFYFEAFIACVLTGSFCSAQVQFIFGPT